MFTIKYRHMNILLYSAVNYFNTMILAISYLTTSLFRVAYYSGKQLSAR